MKTSFTLYVSAVLLLLTLSASYYLMAQAVPCETPAVLARTNGATWQQGATVSVIMNPNAFPTQAERDAVAAAFTAWERANPNAGVHFTFTTGTQPAPGSDNNTFYVHRGTEPTGGSSNIAFSGTPSTPGNRTISAVTRLDPSMTRSSAITSLMIHEIGHTFGLDDCLECGQGSTFMSTYRTDCSCPSNPCDQNAPFNGIRYGCPPLQTPNCDAAIVAQRGGYPTPTPTPIPTPTPCSFTGEEIASISVGQCGFDGGVCSDWEDNDCDGLRDEYDPGCYCSSPVVVDILGNGFDLTGFADGVLFDIRGTGQPIQLSWIQGDDAWLVLDRNGNGNIDNGTELFGNFTPQPITTEPNGFLALAEFDKLTSGGNADGSINAQDSVFSSLRLWVDHNHNGLSEANELYRLIEFGLVQFDLDYKISKKSDEHGNVFRYRAKIRDAKGQHLGRWAWDVFLVTER